MTARQVATHLTRLGCHATPGSANSGGVGINPQVELDCTIYGENVMIDEYRNAEQVAYNMQFYKGMGCQMARAFGFTGAQPCVLGSDWIVTPQTAPTARRDQDGHRERRPHQRHPLLNA